MGRAGEVELFFRPLQEVEVEVVRKERKALYSMAELFQDHSLAEYTYTKLRCRRTRRSGWRSRRSTRSAH